MEGKGVSTGMAGGVVVPLIEAINYSKLVCPVLSKKKEWIKRTRSAVVKEEKPSDLFGNNESTPYTIYSTSITSGFV